MSPAYRAHPFAQAIEEAVRIFGPEVTAAALLAAIEAAPVRSMTQRAEPSKASEFGYFRPSRSFRRKLWTTLAVIAFAALAGAVVFGGGRGSRDDAATPSAAVNAVSSSAVPASAGEPATAARSSPPESPKAACEGDTWTYLDGKCIAAEAVVAPAAPEPERVTDGRSAAVQVPACNGRDHDHTRNQSASAAKERRKASRERAPRDDRRSARAANGRRSSSCGGLSSG